jgi:hypothetical protein
MDEQSMPSDEEMEWEDALIQKDSDEGGDIVLDDLDFTPVTLPEGSKGRPNRKLDDK